MRVVAVHMPDAYLEAIDSLVEAGRYMNRSEAIRMAVRDFIKAEAMFGLNERISPENVNGMPRRRNLRSPLRSVQIRAVAIP
ncbi:MAG: ribbon-helix-helix domain-containing protein [Candidatus Caldarchaeales archaeon]